MTADEILVFYGSKQVQKFLSSADGKGRDHHIAAPVKGFLQNIRQLPQVIRAWAMKSVTVGGFDHHIIRILGHLRVTDRRAVYISQITGAKQCPLFPSFLNGKINACRA